MASGEFEQAESDAAFWSIVSSIDIEPATTYVRPTRIDFDPALATIRTTNFLEYFKQIFSAFDEESYGRQLDEELELGTDLPCMLRIYANEIVAQFAAIDVPNLTDFEVLKQLSQQKQQMSAEYYFTHGDSSLWLRRMLDTACPIGPDVSTADPEAIEQFVHETYGRPSSRWAVFKNIRGAAYTQTDEGFRTKFRQRFGDAPEIPGLLEHIVEVGSLRGLQCWEKEFLDDERLETVREHADEQFFSEAGRIRTEIARSMGIDSADLADRLEELLAIMQEHIFDELELLYQENYFGDEE